MRNRNTGWLNVASASLLVAATLTLVGCAVGPQYTKPEIKPNDNWKTQAPVPSLRRSRLRTARGGKHSTIRRSNG